MPSELTADELKKRLAEKDRVPIKALPRPDPLVGLKKAAAEGLPERIAVAPPPAGMPAAAVYREVPAGEVIPRGDNPRRRIDEKSGPFLDLVASVRAAGIVTPLLGRPHPTMPGCVELLAGHRRRLAGLAAGLTVFPMLIRDVDDRTAAEIMVFENLDRENLTALEEAEGVEVLLRYQHAPAEIAARMGKTVQWVARRRSLLSLTDTWKEWAAERPEVSAGHLEAVARFPEDVQTEILDGIFDDELGNLFMGAGSLARLREYIGNMLMDLKLAPWDLTNAALLPKAGACSECPKRSGCQPDLFGDPEDGEGDRCTDRFCWSEKRMAYLRQRRAELMREHKGLMCVPGAGSEWQEKKDVREKLPAEVLEEWQFRECKQADKGAVPVLIVCGKGMGSLTWVQTGAPGGTRDSGGRKPTAAAKQAAASLDPEASAKLLKEKREGLEKRRWALVCRNLQERLMECDLPPHENFQTAEGMIALAATFGMEALPYDDEERNDWDRLPEHRGREGLMRVWGAVRQKVRLTLEVFRVEDLREEHHEAIRGVAALLTLSVEALKAEADEEVKEPKAWEQLERLAEAPAPDKGKGPKGGKTSAKKKGGC